MYSSGRMEITVGTAILVREGVMLPIASNPYGLQPRVFTKDAALETILVLLRQWGHNNKRHRNMTFRVMKAAVINPALCSTSGRVARGNAYSQWTSNAAQKTISARSILCLACRKAFTSFFVSPFRNNVLFLNVANRPTATISSNFLARAVLI